MIKKAMKMRLMIMSNIVKSLIMAFLLISGFNGYVLAQQNTVIISRDGVRVYDNTLSDNTYEKSDDEGNLKEKDSNIKYDRSDFKKETFRDDVRRNCIIEDKTITTTSYKCSDVQRVQITDRYLFSKIFTIVYEGKNSIRDGHEEEDAIEIRYSYIVYVLLIVVFLLSCIPVRRKNNEFK